MINRTRAAIAAMLVSVCGVAASGQNITSVQVLSGLSRPIFLTHAPGLFNRVFVAEQRGSSGVSNQAIVKMYSLNPTTGALTFVSNFMTLSSVSTGSEQGLLGLAFHPQYLTNGKVYAHFSNQLSAGATTIREYIANGAPASATTASPSAQDVIFTAAQPFSNHNGGWMSFGPDGFLYLALGDGGSGNDPGNRSQNTFNILGKTLRFDVNGDDFPGDTAKDYRIPGTNPFANGAAGLPEIYSFGLRNHWRNDIDPVTGDLYIADVGQNAREEVNVTTLAGANGKNYGWRCLEGTLNTGLCGSIPGGTQVPLLEYDHSSGIAPTFSTGCSITGGMIYRGCAIPDLNGTYFFADVCTNFIFSVKANVATNTFSSPINQTVPLGSAAAAGSIVSWGRDAYGELYICSLNGSIHKIVRTGGTAPADCNGNTRPDCQEIRDGSVADLNTNAVPDTCESPFAFNLSSPANGASGVAVNPTLTWAPSSNAITYNVTVATDAGLTNVVASTTGLAGTSWNVTPNLNQGVTYFWGVRGINPNGNTASNPASWTFTTVPPPPCPGDLNGDGQRNVADLTVLLGAFSTCPGDAGYVAAANIDAGDPCINTADLVQFLGTFGVPCP
ncbi:MAG: PQQ-dependent sugar dehydrogenase [Phycisphaerales bacterium]